MPASETIVAAASPPGRSSRALVRASGPAAPDLASMLFPQPEARSPTVCRWKLGRHACPVIATLSRAPATFTGDDTLELVLPGNPFLVERVLDQWCAHEGVRRAGPGEFSARAYLNGRIALDEAEGVAAVISARTAEDLAAASRLARGQTGDAYRAWAEELTTLLALVEAGIDFTDQEDVVPITPDRLVARLQVLRSEMLARAGGELAVQAADDLPLVVLAGPPNAGKSTLFNALLGRPRAIVADEAGTTRDVLVETLALDEAAGPGLAVRLADLPGLDAAESSPAGQAGQSGAREALARADAVILCDPAGRFEQATRSDAPTLRVRTKADLPGRAGGDVEVCALDGWRMEVLRRGIADVAVRSPNASCAVALARHARNIRIATGALQEAAAGIDRGAHALAAPELIAHGLRRALDELEQVLGRVSPDDVIGRIFATFCVGK